MTNALLLSSSLVAQAGLEPLVFLSLSPVLKLQQTPSCLAQASSLFLRLVMTTFFFFFLLLFFESIPQSQPLLVEEQDLSAVPGEPH